MGNLFVLIGISGSGKTTWALEYAMQNRLWTHISSSDQMRKILYGDESIQKDPEKVFRAVYADVAEWLPNRDVILDATNLKRKDREKIFEQFKDRADGIYAIYFPILVEEAIARDAARDRTVGEKVIRRQAAQLEKPQNDEGWSGIFYGGLDKNSIGLDLCIFCGAYVVEGSHVCPRCIRKYGLVD